jgi:magnesium-protoporphyrin O-methyltransferase
MFGEKIARHEAKQFRRRGLTARARRLLAALERTTELNGRSTLEVGAGVGSFTITMLEHGAAAATIIDASPAYLAAARALAHEFGVAHALRLELADYALRTANGTAADVVVMDRVVCCYPDWRPLLDAATRDGRRVIALTYPRDSWWSRLGIGCINIFLRLRRTSFRVRVHPVALMQQTLADAGFDPTVHGHYGPWEILIATRSA